MSLRTGDEIFRYSLQVVRQHPKLLVFPLLVTVTVLLIVMLLLQPALGVQMDDVRHGLWNRGQGLEAMRVLVQAVNRPSHLPWGWMATGWLIGMFPVTFIQVAYCSQILSALNGGEVSVSRGFAIATSKLPGILPWAALAGTAGVAVQLVERFLQFATFLLDVLGVSILMRKITVVPSVLVGVPWSAAAEFVVPVMLKEPGTRRPLEYLKRSADMVRRVWGDALVIGLVGPSAIGFIAAFCVLVISQFLTRVTGMDLLTVWGALLCFGMVCFADGINRIFSCGLYVFASEGVAPGPFDADVFNRVWSVR